MLVLWVYETFLDLVETIAVLVQFPAYMSPHTTPPGRGQGLFRTVSVEIEKGLKKPLLCHEAHIHPLSTPYISAIHRGNTSPALHTYPVCVEVEAYLFRITNFMP